MTAQTSILKALLKKRERHGWGAKTFLEHLVKALCPRPPRALPVQASAPLTIGSTCSGWCAELWAAELLDLDFHAVFACDVLPVAETICHARFAHDYWFWDCMEEEFMQAPQVDLFVGGLPCQAWSRAGRGLAFDDDIGPCWLSRSCAGLPCVVRGWQSSNRWLPWQAVIQRSSSSCWSCCRTSSTVAGVSTT